MTAREWIAALRSIRCDVLIQPKGLGPGLGLFMSQPVLLPDEVREGYDPERWLELRAELENVGARAVYDELMQEAGGT